jgi:hypothetical protein
LRGGALQETPIRQWLIEISLQIMVEEEIVEDGSLAERSIRPREMGGQYSKWNPFWVFIQIAKAANVQRCRHLARAFAWCCGQSLDRHPLR